MKLFISIFLFAGFLSTAFITKAQDDVYGTPSPVKHKKNNYPREIKTGFVFIDGKYIDTPYIVKRKKLALYLNDIKLWEYKVQTENPYWYPVRLGNPPCINKFSPIDSVFTWGCKDPTGKKPWTSAVSGYFMTHYDPQSAIDSIIEYYRHLPNVKELRHRPGEFWKIFLYNGDSITTMFNPPGFYQKLKQWGPNGTGGLKEKDYIRRINNQIKNIKTNLIQNEMIIITPKQKTFVPMFTALNKVPQKNLLEYFWKMMESDYPVKQKLDSLRDFGFYGIDNLPPAYYDTLQLSPAFKRRIDKMNSKLKNSKKDKVTGSAQLKKMNHKNSQQSNQNRNFSGIFSLPENKNIQYYYPPLLQASSFVVNKKIISLLL